MLYVDANKCAGCGICVEVCPAEAIRLVSGVATINQEKCTECQACVTVCPEGAIQVVSEPTRLPVVPPQPAVIQIKPHPAQSPVRPKMVPALGAIVSFVEHEIAPRVGPYLLDVLTRRLSRPGAAARGGPASTTSRGLRFRLRRRGR